MLWTPSTHFHVGLYSMSSKWQVINCPKVYPFHLFLLCPTTPPFLVITPLSKLDHHPFLHWHPSRQSIRGTFFQPCHFWTLTNQTFPFLCVPYMANNTHIINLAFVIHDVFLIISIPKQLNLAGSIVSPNKCVAWFPSSLLLGSPF